MKVVSHILVAILAVALYAFITSGRIVNYQSRIDAFDKKVNVLNKGLKRKQDSINYLQMQNAGLREKIEELNMAQQKITNIYETKINELRSTQIDAYGASMDTIARFITDYYRD